jgi:23S rRNA (cytidine1920-2'-O)/16S rRNA (cytidine1409-2'-O)-methyltransferase
MRLDQRLVDLGLADSRARARTLIEAGAVSVDGAPARKPAQPVAEGAAVAVASDPNPWVSRAGLKLSHALEVFRLAPQGVALDIGASTGGFTEVLLARGAARVIAVDVGHGQLHPRLAADPRVTCLEGTNARDLGPDRVPPVDWITADVSFISLEKALPAALALARPGAVLVALIKPQFEAGPGVVGKGGILRDPAVQEAVCRRIESWLESLGWQVTGRVPSPIEGADGNREFLIAARIPGG